MRRTLPLADILALMGQFECFDLLARRTQEAIARAGTVRLFRDGAFVYRRGDAPGAWYCLLRGGVRVGSTLRDGRPHGLRLLEPGCWFGETELLNGMPRAADVRVHGGAEVFTVAAASFRRLLAEHADLVQGLLTLQSHRIDALLAASEDAALPLRARLAKQLLQLSAPAAELRLTQDEIAGLVGGSRPKVNRELRALAAEGIITLGVKRLAICDRARLSGVAGA